MIKKFFSLFFLATALVVSTVSAETLKVVNKTQGEVSKVKVTYAEGVLDYTNDLCITYLLEGETGTSDFAEEVKYVKIYTVTYTDSNGVEFTEDYNGKKFYLPAELSLNNKVNAVNVAHNEEAEKAAIEATMLYKASVIAKDARDTVVSAATTAKDFVLDNATSAAETVKEGATDALDTVKSAAKSAYDAILGEDDAQ